MQKESRMDNAPERGNHVITDSCSIKVIYWKISVSMPDQPLLEKLQRDYNVTTVDEMWFKILTEGKVHYTQ